MKDFTEGNIARQLFFFSVPMLIGSIFQQTYSMVDAVIVGRYVGGGALAAVGVSMSSLFFLTSVLMGLTTGASVIIAQFFGARQYDRLECALSTSVLFLALLSALITLLGMMYTPTLLTLLKTPADIFDDAKIYMRIVMSGMTFSVFFNMYTAYLRALGDAKNPLFILIFANVVNIVLDIVFVASLGFGVAGAASATVISQTAAVALCFLYTRRFVPLLRIDRFIFDRELFRSILRYGTPAALQLSFVSLANLTIMRLINDFGTEAIAGITAVTRIDQMAILPISTLSLGLSTFVAQNMGAGLEERAKKGLRSALMQMVSLALVISVLLMIFGPLLISLFINQADAESPEILRIGRQYMNVMVSFYFLFAFLFGFNGFFRGAGDAVIAMVFPVASLTIRTVSAYALVGLADMGPEALAWSIPVGWGLTSVASWVYYKKRLWSGKVIATNMR